MTVRAVLFSSVMAGMLGLSAGSAPALASQSDRYSDRDVVVRAFRSVLGRDPSSSELRRYLRLMEDEDWTERDIRRDLRERGDDLRDQGRRRDDDSDRGYDSDRRRGRGERDDEDSDRRSGRDSARSDDRGSSRRGGQDDEDSDRRSGRDSGRDSGRGDDRGSSRRGGRDDEGSDRRNTVSEADAANIVRDAFRAVLGRDPDANGRRDYTQKVMKEGWSRKDVEKGLRDSPEYASKIVRDAYRAVLGRDPDSGGARDYTQRVLKDHWDQKDIEKALRDSPEYKSKHPR